MNDALEITDGDELKARLNDLIKEVGEDEGRRIAVVIAHRAAMRALPIYWRWVLQSDRARKLDLTPLPILRASLICGVAGKWPTPQIRDAASSSAASFAASSSASSWKAVSADFAAAHDLGMVARPLWPDDNPLADDWRELKQVINAAPDVDDWAFWSGWYDDALTGRLYQPRNQALLTDIALIEPDELKKGPAHVAGLIRDIEKDHADTGRVSEDRTPVAAAALYDYKHDALQNWMDLVGYDEDLKFIDDPERLKAFNRDAVDLIDGLQDFLDYANDAMRGANETPPLIRAVEKVLEELRRAEDVEELRARALVGKSAVLNGLSLEQDPEALFGKTLVGMLSELIADLLAVSRTHLAHSLARLEPLKSLTLGDRDPAAILADLRAAIGPILQDGGREGLIELSPEARAAFRDMLNELTEIVAAIEAAPSDERRATLRNRFAERYAGFAVTLGRYMETAREGPVKWLDTLISMFKRFKSLSDMIEFFEKLFNSSPPT